jgi:hypothetical protein
MMRQALFRCGALLAPGFYKWTHSHGKLSAAFAQCGLSNNVSVNDNMAAVMKPLAYYMEEAGISVAQLVNLTGLDAKLVTAITTGN